MSETLAIEERVPLAPCTTLELGGAARYFTEIRDEAALPAAVRWAADHEKPLVVLGGGSNVLIPDGGLDALVLRCALRGVREHEAGARVEVEAASGEAWDALVERTVTAGLAGLECLSGIPGTVGATPIQNVGAYGQEVSDTIRRVRVFDPAQGTTLELTPEQCAFAYRDSALRRALGRYIVLQVTFALTYGAASTLRYEELARAVGPRPTLGDVRDAVLALRRAKSMLIVPGDDNRRSVGSFFTNPIVSGELASRVTAAARAAGLGDPSSWLVAGGRVKLAAAWLVERAGYPKGFRAGAFGISTKHALALVHHGGGTTRGLLAFADEIVRSVHERFGIMLEREPVLLGPPIVG